MREFVSDIKESEELKGDIVDNKTFDASSREISQESGNSNITVNIVVVVFLLAFAGGFLIGRNRDAEGRRRSQEGAFSRVTEESTRAVDGSAFKSRFRNRKKIYPDDYAPPECIADALVKTGLGEGTANEIANVCRATIGGRDMRERIGGDFTLEDAAAVCLYTLELDKKNMR